MKQLWNEWKIHLTWLYPVTALVFFFLAFSFKPRTQTDLYLLVEVVWPLGLVLSIASILPLEYEEGMLELRLSYAKPYRHSVIKTLALPHLWWVSVGLLAMLCCTKGPFFAEIWHLAAVVIPPAIALSGLALLVSSLTLNAVTSVIVTLAYWVYEWLNAAAQRKMSLFPYYGGIAQQINIFLNRFFLVAVGLLLYLVAFGIITSNEFFARVD